MKYITRIRSPHLNIEFDQKCVVGLLGHFAGTFTRYYICLGSPIVVDSSLVLHPCDSSVFIPASAYANRQDYIFKCAVCILDFASDIQSPTELLTTRPNPCQCNIAALRNGGWGYKADVGCCQLCVLFGKRVYTLPNIPGVHYIMCFPMRRSDILLTCNVR